MACSSSADVLIFGGAAGGGKSFYLAMEPMRNFHIPGFGGVLFRRTSPEISGAGSIWEECRGLWGHMPNAHMREGQYMDWRFSNPGGDALFEFRHLQFAGDVHAHQSKQYALIEFDELTHFEEDQFWYMMSRNRSGCGVRPYIRASCNPDPDSFVATLIDWWINEEGYPIKERSGVLRYFIRVEDELHWADTAEELQVKFPEIFDPKTGRVNRPRSFTFIHSSLEDNQELLRKDPNYAAGLSLLTKVQQERLLHGNWKIRAARGDFFQRSQFTELDRRPDPASIIQIVRAWDKAASRPTPTNPNPDYTASVLLARLRDGKFCILDACRTREDPGGVQQYIRAVAMADGQRVPIAFWQDPGGAGKEMVYHDAQYLAGWVTSSQGAREEKSAYAMPVSAQVRAGNFSYVKGDWNKPFFAELEAFAGKGTKGKDDWVDALSRAFMEISHSDLARLAALGRYGSNIYATK